MPELRVWWVRNPPASPTYLPVATPAEGAKRLAELTAADLANSAIECNAGGLEIVEDGEWTEWYDEKGRDVDEAFDAE